MLLKKLFWNLLFLVVFCYFLIWFCFKLLKYLRICFEELVIDRDIFFWIEFRSLIFFLILVCVFWDSVVIVFLKVLSFFNDFVYLIVWDVEIEVFSVFVVCVYRLVLVVMDIESLILFLLKVYFKIVFVIELLFVGEFN